MSETAAKNTVLIVETSLTQARIITEHIESVTPFDSLVVRSMEEVEEILEDSNNDIFIAVLNLNIKGAPDGEAVDYVLSRKIPCIILTSTFNEKIRNRFIEKNVLDYFNKSRREDLEEMVDLIRRIHSNHEIKVVIAEDNSTARKIMRNLLERLNFTVETGKDGAEALAIIEANPDVKLLLTDYEMPNLDGFELVSEVRKTHSRDQLAILGVSSHDSGAITAKFLKRGANDFLKKPFEVEEFSWRVTNNLNELERIRSIKDAYSRDPLTGFSNLSSFINQGREIYLEMLSQGKSPVLAAFSVDELLTVNARYGWDASSAAIKKAASLLEQHSFGWTLSARSDQGFYILAEGSETLKNDLGAVKAALASSQIVSGTDRFMVSASFTVSKNPDQTLDQALSRVANALAMSQGKGINSFSYA
ncbi:response regulator [Maridesulfovibrio hydrothermalis]|uniref:Response regulator receiver protein n=1 Tax=Maridesulfovibrio hydrothermalis AM13 = DSM 14728 TaxID=1121451 RepID=L0RAR3_9BACT|nr:response regulator [Maridesulfovibrio hydrothermalis]CCO23307.1 Response regulator receiver protein [Maridesulfovibrio hydrothermalis AM13 = DSM 14728]